MNFKVKKIRKSKHIEFKRTASIAAKKHAKLLKGHLKFKNVILIVSALVVLLFGLLLFKGFMFIKELSFKDVFMAVLNKPVRTDEYNHTNILLLGEGGGQHDGANLTDTIMIASIDMKDYTVGILSVPRDLWVETEGLGGARINKVLELSLNEGDTAEEGLELMRKEIQEILNVPIHYYALVDFSGFEDVIDSIGGIEVNVPETLYDPFFPKGETYEYEPFYIKEGVQKLDGETALKYVRSRKTTSDFDRARRQKDVLGAIQSKLLSSEVLFSKTKLKKLYQSYQENIKTDLQMYEFIYLGRKASKFSSANITHAVINDDPYKQGGLLYTPEREFYGGAFVLVPQTNKFDEIQKFANIVLYKTNVLIEHAPIHVLNGTKTPNLAFDGLTYIERYGFDVVRYGNSEEKVEANQIYYRTEDASKATLEALGELLGVEAVSAEGTEYSKEKFSSQADIVVIFGQQFIDFKQQNPKLFYSL
ncbi:MAG: LCP family protein [Candidatus Peregrinibacteria bacterium]|nr:LCP family protein [Candidatus Peregrinibacteria bacterium]MDZ4244985.1 LCP family protein [Candidatus Gracilibacteria bacterium]